MSKAQKTKAPQTRTPSGRASKTTGPETYAHATESYLDSEVKERLRRMHIDAVLDISRRHKRPANLKYLTLAGAHAVDARMLHESAPDVFIHAVECYENQLHQMARNGPRGMASEFDRMDRFLRDFQALPSGIGDPACDGHFIGAFFDWYGALSRESTLAAMQFVNDHRFVKPGFSTAIAFTYNKKSFVRARVDEALTRSLYSAEGEGHRSYSLDSAAEYSMLALHESCPVLEISLLHKEEYRNRDRADHMFFVLVEVKKPGWAPVFPPPGKRIEKGSDGSLMIGGMTLPGGPSLLTLVTDQAAPVAIDRKIEAEIDLLQRHTTFTNSEIKLLDRALNGGTQPMTGSKLGRALYRVRSEPSKAPIRLLIEKVRTDWNTAPRAAAAETSTPGKAPAKAAGAGRKRAA